MTVTTDRFGAPAHNSDGIDLKPQSAAPRPRSSRHRTSPLRRVWTEGGLIFGLSLALYLVVGVLLDFRYLTFNGDAASRLANGFYVLYSRDPHLAAIGFVWNPGTSIADMVPLLFYHLWTPLASHMFAASIVSALSMAGAVYQVRSLLFEWGVLRAPRLILVALFALNAMIIYYGGNGMSEGIYLVTLLATCRYLLRWMRDDDLRSLVYAAVALGLCYLTRNEAVGPAFLAGAVVLGVSFARRSTKSDGEPAQLSARLWSALTDLTIFEIPIVASLVSWAVASFVITGSPFEQFTSIYGNASQEKVLTHLKLQARLVTDVRDVAYLAPTLPIVLLVALFLAVRRRDVGILAPLTVVGGGLAFDLIGYAANTIQPFFRYFITAVPLEILLVGCIFATRPASVRRATDPVATRSRARVWITGGVAVVVSLALLLPAAVTTVQRDVESQGRDGRGRIPRVHLPEAPVAVGQGMREEQYAATLTITEYMASRHLSDGQVVVDNFSGCIPQVIIMSPKPKIFVIPNDRDFQRILDDPLTFHAHYILDVDPNGVGGLTAPNTTFPTLWKSGGGFAKVVHTFPAAGLCAEFKLFQVTGHPNQAA